MHACGLPGSCGRPARAGARRLLTPLLLSLLVLRAGPGLSQDAAATAGVLSASQRAWLAQHPQVRLAPERDYGPFIYVNEAGQVEGLSMAMLSLVQQRTGLGITLLPAAPLAEQLARAQRRDADLLTSLRPTPERGAYLDFSLPYVSVPALLVVRSGGGVAQSLSALAGRPVSVGAGYAVESVVRSGYPGVRWQPVADDVLALRGVAEGRYDAAVVDAASLAFIVRQHGLATLVAVGQVGFDYTLSFAVRKDWPQLREILDAGIRAVPQADRQALLSAWLAPAGTPAAVPPRAPVVTVLALGLLLLGGLLGAWGWQRSRQRAGRGPR